MRGKKYPQVNVDVENPGFPIRTMIYNGGFSTSMLLYNKEGNEDQGFNQYTLQEWDNK
jgi:hypothetical protein